MWGLAWQNLITRPSRMAFAVVGLTIPILAFLGLSSISRGIRNLDGVHGTPAEAPSIAEPRCRWQTSLQIALIPPATAMTGLRPATFTG